MNDDTFRLPGKFDENSHMALIQRRGNLIVGVVQEAPPFTFQNPNTGSWSGFDIGLVQKIAISIFGSQIEGKIAWVPLDPRDRETALGVDRIDLAVGRYEITVARKRRVDFAGPYFTAFQNAVIAQNASSRISGVTELNGQNVCTVVGSTNFEALKAVAPAAVVKTQARTVFECGAELTKGEVVAVVADHVDLRPLVGGTNNKFETLDAKFAPSPYGIGVRKDRTDFRQFLNDQLTGEDVKEAWPELYEQAVPDDDAEQPAVDRY